MAPSTRSTDVRACTNPDQGKLIAVGVVDILPHCVSSVYFYYDPAYAHWELGTLSALNEMALVQRLQQTPGFQDLQWYYLGTSRG